MYMVFVLHGLHKDLESVRNQVSTNPNIPSVQELIDRLLQVPPPEASSAFGSQIDSESLVLVFNSTEHGGQGHGCGGSRGGQGCGSP